MRLIYGNEEAKQKSRFYRFYGFTYPSVENANEALLGNQNGLYRTVNLPWQLCDASRKFVQVFVCSECGKLKRYVEKI